MGVRPHPGDWGIDCFVGSIDDQLLIWQAKYFPDGLEAAQKAQIRKSYTSASNAAAKQGFTFTSWTLVIPCELSPDEHKWWNRFKKDREADGVAIELWQANQVQAMLRSPEGADVRAEYFPDLTPVHVAAPPHVISVPDETAFNHALFVRQLDHAGHSELGAALEQFYNAEILERDLADKRLETRLGALRNYRSDLWGTWGERFAHHTGTEPDESHLLPGLHPDVMERIDTHHALAPLEPLPLSRTHRKGVMHQIVDRGDAGWTRDYKELANEAESDD